MFKNYNRCFRVCLKIFNWRQDACAATGAQASSLRVHGASQLRVPGFSFFRPALGLSSGLSAFVICLLLANGKLLAAPRVEVDQPTYNFGVVTNRSFLVHDFILHNVGDTNLIINQVVSGCNACLRVGINQTNLPPGGTATVRSYLDLRQMSGSESRAILLVSNDPKTPSCVLELLGVVVPSYSIQPTAMHLDLSAGQQSAEAEITPLFELRAPLSIASCTVSNIAARIEQRSANLYVLVVEALNNTPRGDVACDVTISSRDTNDPPCWGICHIRNPPDLELIPPQLKFQPQDEPQMRILWIKQHGSTPLVLLDILAPSDKFACEIVPDPSGFNYRVNITAWQQKKTGQTNCLTLKMQDQDLKEKLVTVPVSVN